MIGIKSIKPLSKRLKKLFHNLNQQSVYWRKKIRLIGKKSQKILVIAWSLCLEIARLIKIVFRWTITAFILAILTLPYQIWRAFVPDRSGSQPVSRFFRRAFEAKSTKRVLGVNLAIMTLTMSIIQNSLPTLAATPNEIAILPEPKEIITTETTFRQPVTGYISQGFSWYHPAIDLAGNDNQIVYPITRGVVTAVESSYFGYGKSIVITHENNLVSRYAHLSKIKVELNETVDKNTALGYVGSTGWSTGPHLHLEIYEQGKAINPLTILPSFK